MLYAESATTDPYFNLAFEQYLFDTTGRNEGVFFLWQNDRAVIIGKNQNAEVEINKEFAAKNDIKVVRRLSGGGAVYHDLGNINFSFITDTGDAEIDIRQYCEPVVTLLRSMGVDAYIGGRNDILVGGKKISGNAQYIKNSRCMHHGTILFNSDINVIEQVLTPSAAKLQSKGVASIRSRMTNVLEHIEKCSVEEFQEKLKSSILGENFTNYCLTAEKKTAIEKIKNERYTNWEWNFGASPRFKLHKKRRIEGCGSIEIYLEAKNGTIEAIEFFGDYFGIRDTTELAGLLIGCRLEETAVKKVLAGIDVSHYFYHISMSDFAVLLCR